MKLKTKQVIKKPDSLKATLLKADEKEFDVFKKKVGEEKVKKYIGLNSMPSFVKWIFYSVNGEDKIKEIQDNKKIKVVCRVYPPNIKDDIYNEMRSESVIYYSIGAHEILRGDIDPKVLGVIGKNISQDDVCREIYFRPEGSYFVEDWANSLCYNYKRVSKGVYTLPAFKGGRPRNLKMSANKWTIVINVKNDEKVMKMISEKLKDIDLNKLKEMFKEKENDEYKLYKDEIDEALDEF